MGDELGAGVVVGMVAVALVAALIPSPSMLPAELEWATEACAANDGIAAARPAGRLILPAKVRCKNGAVFILNASEATP